MEGNAMRAKTGLEDPRDSSLAAAQKPTGKKDEAGAPIGARIQRIAAQPKKGARLIARTFYRELRRAGWADQDIMAIADELLACLLASLHDYRLKKEVPVAGVRGRT
jgi:hypothetical protein